MQHGASEVEHPAQTRRMVLCMMRREMRRQRGFGVIDQIALACRLAGAVEHTAQSGEHRFAAVFVEQGCNGGPVETRSIKGGRAWALCTIDNPLGLTKQQLDAAESFYS